MMKKLLQLMRYAVAAELTEAGKNHGRVFASMHEGYGVMVEEVNEAWAEQQVVCSATEPMLYTLRVDDPAMTLDYLDHIEEHATLAACEWVQVAAMARKCKRTMREDKKNGR